MNPSCFPLVELSGNAHARGVQYGRAVPDRIRRSVALYRGQLRDMALTAADVRGFVQAFVPRIEEFDPLYVEEMRGIADGAGVELADVVLVNARTEVLRIGRLKADQPMPAPDRDPDPEPDGCTGVVLLP